MDELRPNFTKSELEKEENKKVLYEERLELYNNTDFDRQYYIPLDKLNDFLTNWDFDIEYYRINNIKKRREERCKIFDEIYERKDELECKIKTTLLKNFNEIRDNNIKSDNDLFYENKYYLDGDTNEYINETVLDQLRTEYNEEYIEEIIL